MRNCPIDCASIYYNGVRRSGLYTVVPSVAGMPVEVYCDMDTDGESHILYMYMNFDILHKDSSIHLFQVLFS